jgi:hypothetical protein
MVAIARPLSMSATVECNPLIDSQLFDLVEKVAAKQAVPKRLMFKKAAIGKNRRRKCCHNGSTDRL